MRKRVVIIQGHPDRNGGHFCHALADAYARGVADGLHEIRTLNVAQLDLPFLTSREEWEAGPTMPAVAEAQEAIRWAQHMVIVYPLWLGAMPAMLKGFLEQVFRPGFAFAKGARGFSAEKPLAGKTARIVVTMGMPALVYRWWFGAHSLKSLERNILRFVGIRPAGESLVGNVEGSEAGRRKWLEAMAEFGRRAV